MSVRKNATIASIAVMGSRMMGLVREVVFAFFFGASPVLDSFLAAFRIPNLLRDLFSEGALSQSFVTVFSKKMVTHGKEAAFQLANRVLCFVWVFVGLMVLVGIILSPYLVHLIASGFEGQKYDLTVFLVRLLFPFILFVSLAAIVMGMLNTLGKFALPQSASTFFNVTSIITGLLFAYLFSPEYITHFYHEFFGHKNSLGTPTFEMASLAIIGMACGTLLGGLVQWLVQMPALYKDGFRQQFLFDFKNPDLRHVLALTVPAILGGAAVQVNVMVNTNFASFLPDGSISWLNYAFRLMQFPIGVFGVAIASATTPVLARFVAEKRFDDLKATLQKSVQMALFLCIPSALGLILFAKPIIALIYQHGHFTSFDTDQSAMALQAYASGLVFYSAIKIYQPAFLAFGDARTPMLVSLFSILVNVGLNSLFLFVFHFNHWGLALGTSIVALINISLLVFLLRKKTGKLLNSHFLKRTAAIIFSSLVSVFAGWFLYEKFHFGLQTLTGQLVSLIIAVGITVVIYGMLCFVLRVEEVRRWIRK